MIWFRSKIRAAARLALFALAFQMAVSFGHMHPDDLGLPPDSDAQTHLASGATHAPANPANPANRNHRPAPNDYCPICASMQLVATGIPSLPPLLILPAPIRREWPAQTRMRSVPLEVALSFQARAPPTA